MWTDSDRLRVAKYLGYGLTEPELNLIQNAMNLVAPVAIEMVQLALGQLDKVEADIREAAPYAGNSFRSGANGSSQYFRGARMEELKTEGRRQVQGLARMMNVAVYRDIFAAGSGIGRIVRG